MLISRGNFPNAHDMMDNPNDLDMAKKEKDRIGMLMSYSEAN